MKPRNQLMSILAAVTLFGCSLRPSDTAFLHWDVNSALGLLGGPTPNQLVEGKPPIRSPEEIGFLKEAEEVACQRYKKVMALYLTGAMGGEKEKFFATGYELSFAQARLSWSNGQASATVARLEQAVRFGNRWYEMAIAAYDAQTIGLQDLIAASNGKAKARESLDRVRSSLTRLGYDLKDVAQQPQVDPEKPDPAKDCAFGNE